MADDKLILQARTSLWADDVVNNRVFAGGYVRAAVAAQYGKIQLLNPAGSNRVLYVVHCVPIAQSIAAIRLGRHDTALGTVLTTTSNTALGGTAPVGILGSDASITQLLAADYFATTRMVANGAWSAVMPLTHVPIRLDPGVGFLIECDTVNVAFQGVIYWVEKPLRQV